MNVSKLPETRWLNLWEQVNNQKVLMVITNILKKISIVSLILSKLKRMLSNVPNKISFSIIWRANISTLIKDYYWWEILNKKYLMKKFVNFSESSDKLFDSLLRLLIILNTRQNKHSSIIKLKMILIRHWVMFMKKERWQM